MAFWAREDGCCGRWCLHCLRSKRANAGCITGWFEILSFRFGRSHSDSKMSISFIPQTRYIRVNFHTHTLLTPNELEQGAREWEAEALTMWGFGTSPNMFVEGRTLYFLTGDACIPHLQNWQLWLDYASVSGSTRVLEVGALEGRSQAYLTRMSTAWMTEFVIADIGWALDHPAGRGRLQILEANTLARTRVLFGASSLTLPHLYAAMDHAGATFAFAYIDGSHHADDVMLDAEYSFRMLATGGVIVFDDYDYSGQVPDDDAWAVSTCAPRRGIHAFLALHGDELEPLPFAEHNGHPDCRIQRAYRKVGSVGRLVGNFSRPLPLSGMTTVAEGSSLRFPPLPLPRVSQAEVTAVNVFMGLEGRPTGNVVAALPFDVAAHAADEVRGYLMHAGKKAAEHPNKAITALAGPTRATAGLAAAAARHLGGVADWLMGRRRDGYNEVM